jgi:DNA invertase Pin-like site-specific DNA recombinase
MIAGPLSDEKPFDTIIVYDDSRFSRNASDLNQYRKQLENPGAHC